MIGMIKWMLADGATDFRKRSITHFIPFMSPDGPSRGWYRVNAEGVDMNRSYRPQGADSSKQTHEPYMFQKDLEQLMKSKAPVTSLWSMHTWSGPVEPIMRSGPEIGRELPEWSEFREIIRRLDQENLIEDLKLREGTAGYGYISWSEGPHHQFGITTILCEGAGNIYTKDENVKSGETLMRSIAKYYSGVKPAD
jgi:hypothetical protein